MFKYAGGIVLSRSQKMYHPIPDWVEEEFRQAAAAKGLK